MITFSKLGHHGRLGNQMFQYAMMLGVQNKTECSIGIPTSETKNPIQARFNPVTGKYDLQHYELDEVFNISKVNTISIDFCKTLTQYNEWSYHFDPKVLSKDNTNFHGYFQTDLYFTHIEPTIRKEFTFHKTINDYCTTHIHECRALAPVLVSIHVRRGDSLQDHGKFQTFGTMNYFRRAQKEIETRSRTVPHYLIFSDDIDWCSAQFTLPNETVIDNRTLPNPGHYDLCMIRQCDHHIIVSSSFSWWGAWLNPSPSKIVICPERWWGPALHHPEGYIQCSSWIKIPI